MQDAIVYSRKACPLCDEAVDLLRRHGWSVDVIDVDTDPHLVEQHGNCVPVVMIDGKIRFRGRVNEMLLQRLIPKQTP